MLSHNGKIAVPHKDPKTWRSRGRKKRKQSAIACAAIVTPPPLKGPVIRPGDQTAASPTPHSAIITAAKPKRPSGASNEAAPETSHSIIVEPKRKPNSILAHLLDHDGSEAEHRRRGDLADKLFKTIVRRAALSPEK
jgi:hypothetical protein